MLRSINGSNKCKAYESTNDDVKLFVESFIVILDHTVVRNHVCTRNAFVDEFGSSFGLKMRKQFFIIFGPVY